MAGFRNIENEKKLFTKRPPEHKLLFRWRIFVIVITIQALVTPPAFTE